MLNSKHKINTKNLICLLLADIIWGAAFVAQRTGGDVVGAYSFNCVRTLMGALVLLPVIFLMNKFGKSEDNISVTTKDRSFNENANVKKSNLNLIVGGTICGTALMFASNLQQVGITLGASVGKAGFLTACYIIMVPLLGFFMGKKCKISILFGVVLAVAGLYLLCFKEGDFTITKPDILLLLCALAFAIQILAIDHFAPKVDTVKLSCIEFLVCGIETIIPVFWVDLGGNIGNISNWFDSLCQMDAIIPLLYAGICSCGIAYTLQIEGQKNFNPTIASLVMSLESVFSVIFGWLFLQEVLSGRELWGCCMIFIAVIIAQI